MLWDELLFGTASACVVFGQPLSTSTMCALGDPFLRAAQRVDGADQCHFVHTTTHEEVLQSDAVWEDMSVTCCHAVTVSGVVSGRWLVEHGSTMGTNAELATVLGRADVVVVDVEEAAAAARGTLPLCGG